MSESSLDLAICIPTYRRPRLLGLLLGDLSRQSVSIDRLIIVDGDPSSADVAETLKQRPCATRELLYVPSNHANLPYQRFLGWKAASGAARLLYLDDDLRLLSAESVETLLRPLRADRGPVVGTTTEFAPPHEDGDESRGDLGGTNRAVQKSLSGPRAWNGLTAWSRLIRRLGSSHRIPAGGLSPAGHRRPPAVSNKPYVRVGCLRGGVMAYRMSAITHDCFSDAMFAMGERGWGLGEDTLLSRRIGSRGVLLTAFQAGIVHPNGHAPLAYRRDAFGRGYATAFSRRLLNDHFRGFDPPQWPDRLALIQSYAVNASLGWVRALRPADGNARAFAAGYTLGALRGTLQAPASRRLTPTIDWRADAESALAHTRVLPGAPV